MAKIVVVTGAGAGVGRATVEAFAKEGYDVALLSRDPDRLAKAAEDVRRHGVRALAIPTDVADFAPVHKLTAREIERGTQVTYLGQVHGMLAALKRMRTRDRGAIINVGSALAYRSVPLQSIYCGAKFAIRGFTDALRSEIIHDGLKIHVTMVDLPAINTPQFDWALNKMGSKAKPVAPIFQPEVPARAIVFAATHPRRDIWLGIPTIKAILANRIAPGLLDRNLAKTGYSGQLSNERLPDNPPSNLFEPVPGDYGAHGRFDDRASDATWTMFTDRHRTAFWAGAAALVGLLGLHVLAKKERI
jgi:short-subunit dehydrogenase